MNKCTTAILHNIMCSIIATKTCDNTVKAVGNFTNKTTSQLRPLQVGPEVLLIVRFHCIHVYIYFYFFKFILYYCKKVTPH